MREYEVMTMCGSIYIKAEKIVRNMIDDKPIKIMFQANGEIIAEYYTDHIAGWREIKKEVSDV